jgi:hypothetical protein
MCREFDPGPAYFKVPRDLLETIKSMLMAARATEKPPTVPAGP